MSSKVPFVPTASPAASPRDEALAYLIPRGHDVRYRTPRPKSLKLLAQHHCTARDGTETSQDGEETSHTPHREVAPARPGYKQTQDSHAGKESQAPRRRRRAIKREWSLNTHKATYISSFHWDGGMENVRKTTRRLRDGNSLRFRSKGIADGTNNFVF